MRTGTGTDDNSPRSPLNMQNMSTPSDIAVNYYGKFNMKYTPLPLYCRAPEPPNRRNHSEPLRVSEKAAQEKPEVAAAVLNISGC